MKTKNLLMALLVGGLTLASCNDIPTVPEGEFLIEGELKNVPDSVVIGLYQKEGRSNHLVAQDTVIHGKFKIRDTISGVMPKKFCLLCFDDGFPGTWADVWVKSGFYTKVTGANRLLPLWTIESEVPEQKVFNDFLKLCPAERKRHMQLLAEEYDLMRAEKDHGLDWEKIDSLRKLWFPLQKSVFLAEINYLMEIPVTTAWLDKFRTCVITSQWYPKWCDEELIRSLYAPHVAAR